MFALKSHSHNLKCYSGHVIISGKEYYRVSDVCKILGIFKNTLYNWERLGKIPKAHRDPMSGWRLYLKKDVEELKRISGRG